MRLGSVMDYSIGAWMVAWTIVVSVGVSATGAKAASSPDVLELASGRFSTVSGVARFERHQAIHPLYCPIDDHCTAPTSRAYWAVIVQAGGSRYEIDQAFEEGQERAPDSIQFGSVVIRPGSRVTVRGKVELVTRQYGTISEVQSIRVSPPFLAWSCQAKDPGSLVYVDVDQISREGGYVMQVLAAQQGGASGIRKVAFFDHVQLNLTDHSIVFDGVSKRARASLSIQQSGIALNRLDALLEVVTQIRWSGQEIPLETSVPMVCSLTR